MNENASNLARQIGIVQAAIKSTFDTTPAVNTDIIRKLAEYMDSVGTTDVRNLILHSSQAENLNFFFDVKTGHVFDNAYGLGMETDYSYKAIFDNDRDNFIANHAFFNAQTTGDDYTILCTFTRDGFPVFVAVKSTRGNSWNDALHALVFMASIAVAVAVPALGAQIGQAVLGAELAAQYPALASAIGNVAINTALSGGDVQSAVASAVSGGVGSLAGGFVATATDSALIGRVAGSATAAAVNGGNIANAALQSLAVNGVNSLSQTASFQPAQPAVQPGNTMPVGDSWASDPYADAYADGSDNSYPTFADTNPYGDFGGDPYYSSTSQNLATNTAGSMGYHDPVWSVDGSAEGATVALPGANTPPAGPSGVVASANGASITQLALTGLRLVTSWNQAGQPNVRTSNGQVRAQPNGMLISANGQARQMPVGTPYLTSQNSLVTNNGDGTYTTVSASGGVTTERYASLASQTGGFSLGSIPPAVLYGGGALVALLLLTGGRHAR